MQGPPIVPTRKKAKGNRDSLDILEGVNVCRRRDSLSNLRYVSGVRYLSYDVPMMRKILSRASIRLKGSKVVGRMFRTAAGSVRSEQMVTDVWALTPTGAMSTRVAIGFPILEVKAGDGILNCNGLYNCAVYVC